MLLDTVQVTYDIIPVIGCSFHDATAKVIPTFATRIVHHDTPNLW